MGVVRAIVGVIVGFLVMQIIMIIAFMAIYLMTGPDWAFQPESFVPSMAWFAVMLPLGFVLAIVGGLVCALIARRGSKATLVFAIIVLVVGIVMPLVKPENPMKPESRTLDMDKFEVLQYIEQPMWASIAGSVLAAGGILLGGRLRGGRKTAEPGGGE
jgi:hypothetical protein